LCILYIVAPWLQFIVCFLQNIESLEAQLNDALSDRSKADESISSLQVSFMIVSLSILDMVQQGVGWWWMKSVDNHTLA
jgi:hypothetical protein